MGVIDLSRCQIRRLHVPPFYPLPAQACVTRCTHPRTPPPSPSYLPSPPPPHLYPPPGAGTRDLVYASPYTALSLQ